MQGNILFFSYFRKVNRFVADLSLLSDFGSSAGFHVDEGVKARYWINPDKKVLEILHAESRSKQEMALLLCQNFITI